MNKIVKHINGDKTDNRIENLAYVSRSDLSRDLNKRWKKLTDLVELDKTK
jgi:hypothetical protein